MRLGAEAPTSQGFDEFWTAYPKKVGKRAAQIAFTNALKRGAEAEAMVQEAQKYRDNPVRHPDYTALPATWLNQDRWLDEPDVPSLPVVDVAARFDDEPEGISFSDWLEHHATQEERQKAKEFGVIERLG